MNEDKTYIEQFLSGQQKGFEMLVKKYQNRVLNIVYSLIGQDRESEDISQEVFMKVYHNLKTFKQDSQFSTWLYRITVNTSYDFLRKRKNFVNDEVALETTPTQAQGPKDEIILKERDELIQKAISAVPIQFRTALVLKEIDGLSYQEIADVLQCNIGTVESKIFRARQFLKKELSGLKGDIS